MNRYQRRPSAPYNNWRPVSASARLPAVRHHDRHRVPAELLQRAQPYSATSYRAQPYRAQPYSAQPYRAQLYSAQPYRAQLHSDQPYRAPASSQPGKCYICSYSQVYPDPEVEIFHRHFSSLRLREMTGMEDKTTVYLCPSCMSHHQPYPESRIKIVVSDSTLHQFFAPPGYTDTNQYSGDTMHVDYVTIPGATLDTLTNAFRLDYIVKQHTRPLDVVMVGGYNDLVVGHSRDFIVWELQRFANKVLEAGSNLHPDSPNTVAIATLMYPPQLAWFPDNGPYPYSNYVNHREKINFINHQIQKINMHNDVPKYPGFHTYGVRKSTKVMFDRYGQQYQTMVKSHRWEHWREQDPAYMLHLRNDRRFKMGQAINNYFIINTAV